MTLDKILATIVSVAGIAFTYWFFLMRKEGDAVAVKDNIDIIVEGGYSPEVISILKGKTTTINFTRRDPSNCLEEVVLADFKIRKFLPLGQKVSIRITPEKTGKYDFVCGMNMFHGKIIVT